MNSKQIELMLNYEAVMVFKIVLKIKVRSNLFYDGLLFCTAACSDAFIDQTEINND